MKFEDEVKKYVGRCLKAAKPGVEPHVFEALWDGDTQGWFLALVVDGEDVNVLSYGGDFRMFAGDVPPWPEARVASEVGRRLEQLGWTVWFPRPETPDDDAPTYAQRSQASTCTQCGNLFLPNDSPYVPNDICWPCKQERARKRAIDKRKQQLLESPSPPASEIPIIICLIAGVGASEQRMSAMADNPFPELVRVLKLASQAEVDLDTNPEFDESTLRVALGHTRRIVHELLAEHEEPSPEWRFSADLLEFEGQKIWVSRLGDGTRLRTMMRMVSQLGGATRMRFFSKSALSVRDAHILRMLNVSGGTAHESALLQAAQDFGSEDAVRHTLRRLEDLGCVTSNGTMVTLTEKGQILAT